MMTDEIKTLLKAAQPDVEGAESRLPAGYREQDACANCRHVFLREEYDNPDELYCTLNALPRPLSMSVYLHEIPDGHVEARLEKREEWNAWRSGREVQPNGMCLEYVRQD